MQKPFIAQVGLGYWGKNILRNLIKLEVLHSACDVNLDYLEKYKKQYPQIYFTTSFEEILQNPEIKAVVISTSASTHFELTKRALLAGKDVFVEKPLALTPEEGEILVTLAKEKGLILMVGHILHYHPAVTKLKELLNEGKLGKIYYIYSHRLNIGKLRTEENILWSFAPHDISLILDLIGEEPEEIWAGGGAYINRSIYDTTITFLKFKNDLKAHVFVSWLHPYKEQKLIVVGSKGMLVFDDVSQEKLFFYPHTIEWHMGKIPVAQKAQYQIIPVEMKEPLYLELSHFVECVTNRQKPKTDGEEGLRVLKILHYAEKSLETGKSIKILTPMEREKEIYIDKTAIVDPNVIIGRGTKIWHYTHILSNTTIGENCVIGQNCMIGPDVRIGSGCKIQNYVSIFKGVTLEDNVFCGPACVFTNVYNPRAFISRKHEFRETLVKEGATIGANATIICGITIGKYAFVAAGSVVNRDVPDYALVAGVPAKIIGWVCKCGTTLKFDEEGRGNCSECGNVYLKEAKRLIPIQEK